jgi:hypothetical protein
MNNNNLEEPLLPSSALGRSTLAAPVTLQGTMPVVPGSVLPPPRQTKPATLRNRFLFGGRKKRLVYAAGTGNLSVVRELIEGYGIDVNAASIDGWTALMGASYKGHLDVVRYLVDHDANVNAASIDGWTALMGASYKGHLDVVRYLVDHGANVNAVLANNDNNPIIIHGVDALGADALILACGEQGHLEIVRYLVDHGANVNAARSNGWTALMVATWWNHLEIVGYLCQNGADATITMRDGRKAIDLAKNIYIKAILTKGCPPVQAPETAAPQGGYYRRTRHRRKRVKRSKRKTRTRR